MLFLGVLIGVIFIICGLLVKRNPDLIAGYNSMSAEEKKGINIKKLSSFLHNGLIIIGVLVILAGIILSLLKVKDTYSFLILVMITILGLLYTLINAPKH